ncbi:nucleotide exchange factor GrpE [Candidatus Chazhemtobacterium aquaticus]|jgi:molecular chaperone GrpE|uniref:Protein GrpE n=1 Tax=Candidatus Chazhemtobacterium aquaticus TaxID=2715735 RepID=A0A857NA42_9BACT|nr:nucleotide exchange factor GrpE [Candidatus Chazhemtobacterium aquaticus]QHO63260.1 Chaperone protein GrpE [Candidatus Chazhemtobacterium aquaticus]
MLSSKKTSSKTIHLQNQIQDLENRFKRALADYQNLEKRHASQKGDLIKFANQGLLDKLLPLLDDLERAQAHLQDSGLELIIGQFRQLLISEGVTPIISDRQIFDPQTMDCAEVVPGPKNKVVTTLAKGYYYHDRVLRPARVEVGSGQKK